MKPMIACLALFSTLALAHPPMGGSQMQPGAGPRIDIAQVLGIDADRAAQVEAILKSARDSRFALRDQSGPPADAAAREAMHAKMLAIRDDTQKKLAAVLSADELQKLRDAMPGPAKASPRIPGQGPHRNPGF